MVNRTVMMNKTLGNSTTQYMCNNVYVVDSAIADPWIAAGLATLCTGVVDTTSTPLISSGAGAPAGTPTKVGDVYVNTTDKLPYMAGATGTSADFLPVVQTANYDAIVYMSGAKIYAKDKVGKIITSGVVGTDDATVINATFTALAAAVTNPVVALANTPIISGTVDNITDTVTSVAHGYLDTQPIYLLDPGVVTGVYPWGDCRVFYVRDRTVDTFKVCNVPGGAAINLTASGTIKWAPCYNLTAPILLNGNGMALTSYNGLTSRGYGGPVVVGQPAGIDCVRMTGHNTEVRNLKFGGGYNGIRIGGNTSTSKQKTLISPRVLGCSFDSFTNFSIFLDGTGAADLATIAATANVDDTISVASPPIDGTVICFTNVGTALGISINTKYYARDILAGSFKCYTVASGGSPVDITQAGSVQFVVPQSAFSTIIRDVEAQCNAIGTGANQPAFIKLKTVPGCSTWTDMHWNHLLLEGGATWKIDLESPGSSFEFVELDGLYCEATTGERGNIYVHGSGRFYGGISNSFLYTANTKSYTVHSADSVFHITNHGYNSDDIVYIYAITTGTFSNAQVYCVPWYVVKVNANDFTLRDAPAGGGNLLTCTLDGTGNLHQMIDHFLVDTTGGHSLYSPVLHHCNFGGTGGSVRFIAGAGGSNIFQPGIKDCTGWDMRIITDKSAGGVFNNLLIANNVIGGYTSGIHIDLGTVPVVMTGNDFSGVTDTKSMIKWGANVSSVITDNCLPGVNAVMSTAAPTRMKMWDNANWETKGVVRRDANTTTASNAAGDMTSMKFYALPNQTYKFKAVLKIGVDNTGGSKLGVNFPSGGTLVAMVEGDTTSLTAYAHEWFSATADTLTTTVFHTTNNGTGIIYVEGTYKNGATAGNVQMRYASGVNTQTTTIYAGSFIEYEMLASPTGG